MAIAGGTTIVDLMKLNVLTPKSVIHVRKALSDDMQETILPVQYARAVQS